MIFVLVISILLPVSKQDPDFNKVLQELFAYQRYMAFPLFDLIVSSSITYVFYYQALVVQREHRQVEIVSDEDDESEIDHLEYLNSQDKKEGGMVVNTSNVDLNMP
jgi:hypothetical protein